MFADADSPVIPRGFANKNGEYDPSRGFTVERHGCSATFLGKWQHTRGVVRHSPPCDGKCGISAFAEQVRLQAEISGKLPTGEI